MFTRLFFGLVRSSLSGLIRYELITPGSNFLSNHTYNLIVTGHRVIIVFFFIIPFLIGRFRNWLIPLMCSSADMSFPRINNLSFWLLLPASFLLVESVLVGGAGSGWTIYPPLSSGERAIDYVILSLHSAGISSILGSANFLVTMLTNCIKRAGPYAVGLFIWCMLVTAIMLLTTLPVLARCITMILFDRHLNTSYFDKAGGRDAVLFQHLFSGLSVPHFLMTSINKVIRLFLILTLCSTGLMLISLKTFFRNYLSLNDTFFSPQETITRYPVKWHSFEQRNYCL